MLTADGQCMLNCDCMRRTNCFIVLNWFSPDGCCFVMRWFVWFHYDDVNTSSNLSLWWNVSVYWNWGNQVLLSTATEFMHMTSWLHVWLYIDAALFLANMTWWAALFADQSIPVHISHYPSTYFPVFLYGKVEYICSYVRLMVPFVSNRN